MVEFLKATPIMTSNTLPSGIASGDNATIFNAYQAFDGVTNDESGGWLTSGIVGWLAYEFQTPKIISKYSIIPRFNNPTQSPKNFTFEGTNDNGTTWVILDTQSNQTGWSNETAKEYTINNNTNYKKYRVNINENNGDVGVAIGELLMYETIFSKNIIIKNTTTNQHYSLAEKTLIKLPNTSIETIINHGINSGVEIKLDEPFDKISYVQDTSEVLGSGKVFTSIIDTRKIVVKKVEIK